MVVANDFVHRTLGNLEFVYGIYRNTGMLEAFPNIMLGHISKGGLATTGSE